MKRTALVIGDGRSISQQEVSYRIVAGQGVPVHVVADAKQYAAGVARITEIVQSAGWSVRMLTIAGTDDRSVAFATAAVDSGAITYVSPQSGYVVPSTTLCCSCGQVVSSQESLPDYPAACDTGTLLAAMYQMTAEQLADIGVIVLYDYGGGVCNKDVRKAVADLSALYSVPVIFAVNRSLPENTADVVLATERVAVETTAHAICPGLGEGYDLSTQRAAHAKVLAGHNLAKKPVHVLYGDGAIASAAIGVSAAVLDPPGFRQTQNLADTSLEDAAAITACLYLDETRKREVSHEIQDFLVRAREQAVGSYLPYDVYRMWQMSHAGWTGKLQASGELIEYVARSRRVQELARIVLVIGLFDKIDHTDIELLRLAKTYGERVVVAYRREVVTVVPDSYRATHLAMLPMVDFVCGYAGDYAALVRSVKPDVLIDADSAPGMPIPGDDFIESRGGLVLTKPTSFYSL